MNAASSMLLTVAVGWIVMRSADCSDVGLTALLYRPSCLTVGIVSHAFVPQYAFMRSSRHSVQCHRNTLKVAEQSAELLRTSYGTMGLWSWGAGTSTTPEVGVADTRWTCRSLLSPTRTPENGPTKARRSPSSPTASRAPSSGPGR